MDFHILVVEDDPSIANLINLTLAIRQYRVTEIHDGGEALEAIRSTNFDLALLDIMLPGLDGYALLEELKKRGVPTIFVSAKTELNDRVTGLNLGAEDYISKPFEPLELLARVETALRRVAPPTPTLSLGAVVMHTDSHSVTRAGEAVELTKLEYALLELLMRNPEMVFSRDQLLDRIWGYDYMGGTRTVDMHIKNLRAKLGLGEAIRTVHKIGYKLSGRVE